MDKLLKKSSNVTHNTHSTFMEKWSPFLDYISENDLQEESILDCYTFTMSF